MTSNSKYAQRIKDMPISFVREILKVTNDKSVTSFAGGLPDASTFPMEKLKFAANKAIDCDGAAIFQYGKTTGFEPLREWIVNRYHTKYGIQISSDQVLLTNGSQQGIDLISKVFLNKEDGLIIEEPGYLGAIQAYHCYEPKFHPIPIDTEGIDIETLEKTLVSNNIKIIHIIPNHQNPSGISYSKKRKEMVTEMAKKHDIIIVEDDPYAELSFRNHSSLVPAIDAYEEGAIHLGSFSKTIAPGLRLGWIVAKKQWIDKLETAKQSCDLHTNNMSQVIIYNLLTSMDFNDHTSHISQLYAKRCSAMIAAIKSYFPHDTVCSEPKGGMFIWCKLDDKINTRTLLNSVMDKCFFVPGDVFHVNSHGSNTMRLNFSSSSSEEIVSGIKVIGDAIKCYK